MEWMDKVRSLLNQYANVAANDPKNQCYFGHFIEPTVLRCIAAIWSIAGYWCYDYWFHVDS